MPRSASRTVVYIALVGLAAAIAVAALIVDDWSRDFTTNVAETAPEATDPLLRPVVAVESVPEVVAALREATATLPRWTWVGEDIDSGGAVVRLVRATRFLGFKDDIAVRVEPAAGGTIISARSESRVGSGDLGQNPRNLRELLRALRRRLGQ